MGPLYNERNTSVLNVRGYSMTIIQLVLLAIGLGWITVGGLALYRRDVD